MSGLSSYRVVEMTREYIMADLSIHLEHQVRCMDVGCASVYRGQDGVVRLGSQFSSRSACPLRSLAHLYLKFDTVHRGINIDA
jgi:hypothetical protein